MKKLLSIAFLMLLLNNHIMSQSNGMMSQYMFNRLLINSAYAGSEESLTLGFLNKNQWSGVKGAPSTQVFSGHSPVNDKVGLGLTLVNDQMGELNQKGLYGAYAYRIKSNDFKLSFGIQAGLTFYKYDEMFLKDKNDPVFYKENSSLTEPDFGAAVYYENNRMYLGFSVPQFFNFNPRKEFTISLQQRNYILHSGYSFAISEVLTVNPSALVYFNERTKPEINLNTNFLLDNLLWVGAIYRNFDNLGLLSKLQLNTQIQLGYGYDFNMGELKSLSAGSHEIMIKYSFIYVEKNVISPRFF
jgi:type IX secretion system PorP/SprF family membrane protein